MGQKQQGRSRRSRVAKCSSNMRDVRAVGRDTGVYWSARKQKLGNAACGIEPPGLQRCGCVIWVYFKNIVLGILLSLPQPDLRDLLAV